MQQRALLDGFVNCVSFDLKEIEKNSYRIKVEVFPPGYYLLMIKDPIKRFNQAWLLDPNNQLALWGFAVTSIDRGDWDAALHYYRMAIESGPYNPRLERDYKLGLRQVEKIGSSTKPHD